MCRNFISKNWNEFGGNGRMFMQRTELPNLKSSSKYHIGLMGGPFQAFVLSRLGLNISSPGTMSAVDS